MERCPDIRVNSETTLETSRSSRNREEAIHDVDAQH